MLAAPELAYMTPAERRFVEAAAVVDSAASAPRALVRYQRNPIGFLREILGIPEETIRWSLNPGYASHQWDGTPDPLVQMCEGLARGASVGVEAGTGTQKSFTAGALTLWFLGSFEGSLVPSFAPKEDQLRLFMWREITRLWPAFQREFPTAELTDLRIRMDGRTDHWSAHGVAVGVGADETSATKAQGFHAPHMMAVTEETPGIHPAVMTAINNTLTGSHNLQLSLGNPDSQHDALHVFCTRPGVVHVRISSYDHPNIVTGRDVVPGAASPKSIADRRADYGEGSPMFESRVRGISPQQATDSLIRREWLDRAVARYVAMEPAQRLKGAPALGVDVANSENGDRGAKARGNGPCLHSVESFPCPNANLLGAEVVGEMDRDRIDQAHVGVDPVGVGAGTVNEAARLGRVVRRLNGAARPVQRAQHAPDGSSFEWAPDANSFNNLRSQMWWQTREDLRHDRLAISPDVAEAVFRQLTTVRFKVSGGKTVVESKDEMKKRTGGSSPDDADAVVYWNWVRPRAQGEVDLGVHPKGDTALGYDYQKRQMRRGAGEQDARREILGPTATQPRRTVPFRVPRRGT